MIKVDYCHNGTPVYYTDANMTWQELADFINNHMPECNRNQKVRVWNSGEDGEYGAIYGGEFCNANSITPYDDDAEPTPDNIYFISFTGENAWW